MKKEIINNEVIKKLMESKDKTRGVDFKTEEEFILREKGEKGLEKVETVMAEMGHPIKYAKINTLSFYHIGLRVLSLLVIKEIFNFDEEKIEEMGKAAARSSLVIKLLMRFFASIPRLKKETSKVWGKYHTTGELKLITPERDFAAARLPGHKCILRLIEHKIHPVYCSYLKGFFLKTVEMAIGTSPVTCQEIKCPFRGDKYHEYYFTW